MNQNWETRHYYVACVGLLALAGCSLLLAPPVPRSPQRPAGANPAPPGGAPPLDELRRFVSAANRAGAVRHVERFGPVLPDTTLLVVRARRDAVALARLLRSLRRVPDIGRALLVVSHGLYDASVERELRGVDFCRIMQVYFPHSSQLHPDEFPGPESCAPAADADCTRKPARVERKQHWWWTADLVFERLTWSRSYFGHAVFLEEDARAAPDLLHVLRFLQRAATAYFPHVTLLALGGGGYCGAADTLLLQPWEPALMAAPALNRAAWLRLSNLASFYCIYDDASWSRSLQHVLEQLPHSETEVLAPAAARILTPAGGRELQASELFPARMRTRLWLGWAGAAPARAVGRTRSRALLPGQFADLRDQMMCLDSYMATPSEEDEPATTARDDAHHIEVI